MITGERVTIKRVKEPFIHFPFLHFWPFTPPFYSPFVHSYSKSHSPALFTKTNGEQEARLERGERGKNIFFLFECASICHLLVQNFKTFHEIFENGAPQGVICSLFSFTKSFQPFNLQNEESANRSRSQSNLQKW